MTPASVPELHLALPAAPESVRELREAARELARAAGLAKEQESAVALAVTEAVTNAVVHAYVGRDEPGPVVLAGHAEDDQLVLEVRDEGSGLTPRIDSPGLGLGLPLLGRLCAHFDVGPASEEGAGTRVTLVFDAPGVRGSDDGLRARLHQVLGGIEDAVTVSDGNGRMVYGNAAALALLGAGDAEEVADGDSAELAARFSITRPDGEPVTLEDLPDQRLLAGDPKPAPLLTRSVHLASGRSRWLLTTASPLADDLARGRRLALNVIRDVTAATDAERRQRYLTESGEALATSLDLDETFQRIAELAVPELADWCAVDVVGYGGVLRRVALAHRDPSKVELAWEIDRRFPVDPETDGGGHAVVRTGEPLFLPDLPDELLAQGIADPEHLALLRQIGMRSVLLAPMAARGRVVGVLTLVTADSARAFTEDDVDFAMAVARRAGLAVDTAQRLADR